MVIINKFGDNLRRLREAKGISQTDLSRIFQVARSSIGQYENDTRMPTRANLEQMCKYFKVETKELLGLNNEELNETFISRKIATLDTYLLYLVNEYIDKLLEKSN